MVVVAVISPALPTAPEVVNTVRWLGMAKFARLNTLNTSSRACTLTRPAEIRLLIDMSVVASPGPINVFRPRLPK